MEVVLTLNKIREFAQKAYEHGFYLVFVTGFPGQPKLQTVPMPSRTTVLALAIACWGVLLMGIFPSYFWSIATDCVFTLM